MSALMRVEPETASSSPWQVPGGGMSAGSHEG